MKMYFYLVDEFMAQAIVPSHPRLQGRRGKLSWVNWLLAGVNRFIPPEVLCKKIDIASSQRQALSIAYLELVCEAGLWVKRPIFGYTLRREPSWKKIVRKQSFIQSFISVHGI